MQEITMHQEKKRGEGTEKFATPLRKYLIVHITLPFYLSQLAQILCEVFVVCFERPTADF